MAMNGTTRLGEGAHRQAHNLLILDLKHSYARPSRSDCSVCCAGRPNPGL